MRVAILGCGYVGLELGRQLAAVGDDPVGIRRSEHGLALCEAAGVPGVQADLTDPASLAAVPDADALVYAASPSRGVEDPRAVRVRGVRGAVSHFADRSDQPTRLVGLSSTGVYGDRDGDRVDEATPIDPRTDREQLLADAEEAVHQAGNDAGMTASVVRLGGLYGPGRYRLDRYLDGPVAAGTLNLIHREDAAGVVRAVLESADPPSTLCAVDDEPADKHELAAFLAAECRVATPDLVSVEERVAAGDLSNGAARRLAASKRVAADRRRELGYELRFPTFREGYRPAIRACSRRESY